MKKGFTLLELIITIIIVSILATLGSVYYQKVMEEIRAGEAKMNLGTLRKLEVMHYQDHETYASIEDLDSGLPVGCLARGCVGRCYVSTDYYFEYNCDSSSGACAAARCWEGGKSPPAQELYFITMTIDGELNTSSKLPPFLTYGS